MISTLVLGLFGLLQAEAAGGPAMVEPGASEPPALVVVALPANANRAILEALNRLRGEAISVGLEVRLVEAATTSMSLARLTELSRGLRSAAVVAFAGPEDGAPTARALDVWFLDRASGKISVAHLTTDDDASVDRREVVLAVRAVDFIRARMFDTLVGRRVEPAPPPVRPAIARVRRNYLAAGIGVLGGVPGFSPALIPHIEVGYLWSAWSRVGVAAFGFGTRPGNDGDSGRVTLDTRFVGASLTLLGRSWHRLKPVLDLGGGECWVLVRGEAKPSFVSHAITLSSPAAVVAIGLEMNILPYLLLEIRGGTLWLQRQARIDSTEDTYLGSVGRSSWVGSARLGASF